MLINWVFLIYWTTHFCLLQYNLTNLGCSITNNIPPLFTKSLKPSIKFRVASTVIPVLNFCSWWFSLAFRRNRNTVAKGECYPCQFTLVCSSVDVEQVPPQRMDFCEILYVGVFEKMCRRILLLVESDKRTGHFTWRNFNTRSLLALIIEARCAVGQIRASGQETVVRRAGPSFLNIAVAMFKKYTSWISSFKTSRWWSTLILLLRHVTVVSVKTVHVSFENIREFNI